MLKDWHIKKDRFPSHPALSYNLRMKEDKGRSRALRAAEQAPSKTRPANLSQKNKRENEKGQGFKLSLLLRAPEL